jgi:hypothetical protein
MKKFTPRRAFVVLAATVALFAAIPAASAFAHDATYGNGNVGPHQPSDVQCESLWMGITPNISADPRYADNTDSQYVAYQYYIWTQGYGWRGPTNWVVRSVFTPDRGFTMGGPDMFEPDTQLLPGRNHTRYVFTVTWWWNGSWYAGDGSFSAPCDI